ncbi:MAG TPA: hypothetical protein VF981_14160 [Gemmatimonadaceae bacterium]
MSDADDLSLGAFYCPACNTIFPTSGNAPASTADLANELEEHLEDFHD